MGAPKGMARRGILATAAVLLVATGCGSEQIGPPRIPESWLQTVDDQWRQAGRPTGDAPTIDMAKSCELDVIVEIDGTTAEQQGAGPSGLPGGGRRYVCDFSDPAAVTLIAGRYADASYLQREQQHWLADGGATVNVDGAAITVHHTSYPNGDTAYLAMLPDKARKAFASVEVIPYDAGNWNRQKTAQLLADLVRD
ncbi:MAG: hypothetical protein GEV03_23060 [Streptosporangiales bacterium]|nr:hypothetical protein [Streptosporangiales bacterium]